MSRSPLLGPAAAPARDMAPAPRPAVRYAAPAEARPRRKDGRFVIERLIASDPFYAWEIAHARSAEEGSARGLELSYYIRATSAGALRKTPAFRPERIICLPGRGASARFVLDV